MKSIAEQVTNSSQVPEKEYFIDKVGANGAVVSTADELRAAIDAGKETICVYGQIDLGDISTTDGITLAENQKLVGVNYFGRFSNGEGFSGISGVAKTVAQNLITIDKTGCLVSDLSIDYRCENLLGYKGAIGVTGANNTVELRNLNVVAKVPDEYVSGKAAIRVDGQASANVGGKIDIKTLGRQCCGFSVGTNSTLNILSDAVVNINTSGDSSHGYSVYDGTLNIASGARVNITTSGNNSHGMYIGNDAILKIDADALVNIRTSGNSAVGIGVYANTNTTIGGNVQIATSGANAYGILSWGGVTNILSTANVYINSANLIRNYGSGQINIASQAKIGVENNGQKKWYEASAEDSIVGTDTVTADNITTKLNLSETEAWETAGEIIEAKNKEAEENKEYTLTMSDELSSYQQQYNKALSQYDKLISDSSYKGVNLLKGESLKINFNEDRSAGLVVQGEDLSSDKIGLGKAEWTTTKSL